jgi:DNA modification methylase
MVKLIHNDCLKALKELKDNSIDSCVTDPPYGLSFMGKKWDYDVPSVKIWKEVLRVMKPGAFLLSFAGTRTHHRMAVNIEDAGFEIRDMIAWIYGSGFPKSLNIGKAVDKIAPRLGQFDEFAKHLTEQIKKSGKSQKEIASLFPSKTGRLTGCVWNWANGANVPTVAQWNILKPFLDLSDYFLPLIERIEREREVVGTQTSIANKNNDNTGRYNWNTQNQERKESIDITKGTSEWEGWGTALKPALEPIVVARKPFNSTVAENVLKWGVGGINIDGSRINYKDDKDIKSAQPGNMGKDNQKASWGSYGSKPATPNTQGRFPANFIHDGSEEVERLLGKAQRFFYTAKASKSERNKGLEGFEEKEWKQQVGADSYTKSTGRILKRATTIKNHHPTVKPVKLMQELQRLKITTPQLNQLS